MTVSTGSTHDNILHVKNDIKKNSRFDLCVMLLLSIMHQIMVKAAWSDFLFFKVSNNFPYKPLFLELYGLFPIETSKTVSFPS